MDKTDKWVKMCLAKKKLTADYADHVVSKSNGKLRVYYCPHCFHYHVTLKRVDDIMFQSDRKFKKIQHND